MPQSPRPVYGTIKDNGVALPNRKVRITNDTTGDIINTVTDSDGKYLVDAANFDNGYTEGDTVIVSVDGKSNTFDVEIRYATTDLVVKVRKDVPLSDDKYSSWVDITAFGCDDGLEINIMNTSVNGDYSILINYEG